MALHLLSSSFYLLILILVSSKIASVHFESHIDLVLQSGLIRTSQQSIIQVVTFVTEPIAQTSIQQAYSGTTTSPKKRNTGPNSTANSVGACSASPAAAFKQATQTSCNGPNKSPGTAVPPRSRSGPTPTGDCCKRSIAGHTTLNHIKKPALPSTIQSLGGCSVATPTSWPLSFPGGPSVYSDMIQPDSVGKMNPKFSKISRYDRATRIGDVFTTTRLHADELFNLPKWQDSREVVYVTNNRWSLDHACVFS